MQIPKTTHTETFDATLLTPMARDVVRFKLTVPVVGEQARMLLPLYADLLSRGTRTKSRQEFAGALDALGTRLTAVADRTGLTLSGAVPVETLEGLLTLVREMLTEPAFAPAQVRQVHRHYAQQLHEEADDARATSYGAYTRVLYPNGHPYRAATREARRAFLDTLTRADYRALHRTIADTRAIVSVSGTPAAREAVLGLVGALAGTNTPQTDPQGAAALAPYTHYETVPGRSNVDLHIGHALPLTLTDPAYPALTFGLAVLGKWGGFSGRLMSTVREREGLTYTIYARTEGTTATHAGMWYIYTFFTPNDLARGLASTRREIEHIVSKGVTLSEVTRFKELLRNQFVLAHESDAKTLALYHTAACVGLWAADLHAQQEALEQVTRPMINAALAKYLNPTALVISGAGPVTRTGDTLRT